MGKQALLCVTNASLVMILLAACSFTLLEGKSQPGFYYPEILISPSSPTTADSIKVTVEVFFSTSPPYVDTFGSILQEGHIFSVILYVYVPYPDQYVMPITHTDSYTYHLGELDDGMYEVEAYVYAIGYNEGMFYGGNQVTFIVGPNPYPADVNHDLKVDIFDLVICAGSYGATLIDLNWNAECDLAVPYGLINILDLVTLASHYGEEYTP
jgi:hypothetical protein